MHPFNCSLLIFFLPLATEHIHQWEQHETHTPSSYKTRRRQRGWLQSDKDKIQKMLILFKSNIKLISDFFINIDVTLSNWKEEGLRLKTSGFHLQFVLLFILRSSLAQLIIQKYFL